MGKESVESGEEKVEKLRRSNCIRGAGATRRRFLSHCDETAGGPTIVAMNKLTNALRNAEAN
jgi:hypothetical protein